MASAAAIDMFRNNVIAGLPPSTQPRLSAGIAMRNHTPNAGISTIGMSNCAMRLMSVVRSSRVSSSMRFTTTHATSAASVMETMVRKNRLGQKLGLKKPSTMLLVTSHSPGVSCQERMPLMMNRLAHAATA